MQQTPPAARAAAWLAALTVLAASATAEEIAVDSLQGWTSLSYRNIPANTVSASPAGLRIAVDRSAGPLVYRLPAPAEVKGFTVRAHWQGELNVPPGETQGDKGADDFVLRFGLVEAGEQTLNWLQRRIAADWILELFRLAPKGSGVKKIDFYSTTQQAALLGRSRTHPLSDLLHETWITQLDGTGRFELTHSFSAPVRTLGLWISSDGDDTGATFELVIESIVLHE